MPTKPPFSLLERLEQKAKTITFYCSLDGRFSVNKRELESLAGMMIKGTSKTVSFMTENDVQAAVKQATTQAKTTGEITDLFDTFIGNIGKKRLRVERWVPVGVLVGEQTEQKETTK